MRNLIKTASVAAMSLTALPAWATMFNATIPDALVISGNFLSAGVTSPGASALGGALLTFDLIGIGGIDGVLRDGGFGRVNVNDVSDNFGFRVNDPTIDGVTFGALLNMGGAFPGPVILYDNNPDVNPLNVTLVSYIDNGPGLGGLAQFSVTFTMLSGYNDFAFSFGCCSPANGGEEGWGLRNMVITAELLDPEPPVNGVPEPMTLSLLGAGLGGMARLRFASAWQAWLRRRRQG